jgi:cellulose synthase/poly-beta-1,6-N-acetylglucosamine synthase-like glycosyltransferase/peptidoglycan/xylan/chitin deacetylase (PgdA/CDA1 family)/spore germination protein YaaH
VGEGKGTSAGATLGLMLPRARFGWRLIVITVLVSLLAVWAGGIDPVAGLILGAGVLAGRFAIRRRGRRTVRWVAGGVSVFAVVGAGSVAAATMHWHIPRSPLLVRSSSTSRPPADSGAVPRREVLGFVASDESDSVAGVDRDAAALSELAATGVTLGAVPGSLAGVAASDTLLRSHLNGARGYLVVSNYDDASGDFNGRRAEVMLASPSARAAVVAGLRAMVTRQGWDGVVLDLESTGIAGRAGLVALTGQLHAALAGRAVIVAVPAWEATDTGAAAGIDLAGLAASADRIVWMAYDQHDPSGAAGPVGDLRWTRVSVSQALRSVPADKLLLGVAGYGYLWPASGSPSELTYPALAALAAGPGAVDRYDPAAGERHVVTADGGQAWFQDARSMQDRARLASQLHLAGLAVWRIGSEESGSLGQLPGPVLKHDGLSLDGRIVQQVHGAGAIALTFDDGPDPTWTPQILDILERRHVPGTFFVIGREAESSPDLVRREVDDADIIANHTYSHPDMNQIPQWRAKLEIVADEAVLQGITGRKPLLFRSPYGNGDANLRGAPSRNQLAASLGMHAIGWTDDPTDWARPGVARIVDAAVAQAGDSGVILLHDGGGNRAQTVAALPLIIDRLRAQGYTFTTADALDGDVVQPYASRDSGWSKVRGLAVVTGFRLAFGLTVSLRWLVLVIALLSIARLVVTVPLAFVHRSRGRRAPSSTSNRSSISVLIPAHNEAAVIGKALAALAALPAAEAPGEIIVIDDGSSDDTARIAAAHWTAAVAASPSAAASRALVTPQAGTLRVISQVQAGKAAALNAGIAAANGQIVVVLDADTIVTPGMLPALAGHFDDSDVGAVAGNVKVGNRRGLLARLQAAEYVTSLNLDRRAQAVLNTVAVVPGAAGAFRRQALLEVGGYPTGTLVEDADLTVRLLRAGWRIPYEARAVAWTEAPQSIVDALRQRRRWAFGTVQLLFAHADIVGRRSAGPVGVLGLPWTMITQVLLPAAAPIADLYLLYLLLSGDAGPATVTLLLSGLLDVAVVALAVALEGEDWRMIVTAPALRWIWRPLLVVAVAGSVRRWLRGESHRWAPSRRYATVLIPGQLRLQELVTVPPIRGAATGSIVQAGAHATSGSVVPPASLATAEVLASPTRGGDRVR